MWRPLRWFVEYSPGHFYSHISTRCDAPPTTEIPPHTAFLLTHLYEMWPLGGNGMITKMKFLLTHLYEMWHNPGRFPDRYLPDFYSHISTRCDNGSRSQIRRLEISTHTSLRDVTQAAVNKVTAQLNFYSHISTRCDPTSWHRWSRSWVFLLTHLYEMWLYK